MSPFAHWRAVAGIFGAGSIRWKAFSLLLRDFFLVELFKHKDRIIRASKKSEDDVLEALHTLVAAMEFMDESAIPIGTWLEAHRLCAPTDPKDTPYVALALYADGELWTEDEELKQGLRARGFTRFF